MSTLRVLFSNLLDHPSDDDLRARLRDELIERGEWDWHTLLQYVLNHPEADGPRLLAADWLEHDEQIAQADFIRAQCRLIQMLDVYGSDVVTQPQAMVLGRTVQILGTQLASSLTDELIPHEDLKVEVDNWNQLTLRGGGVTLIYVRGFLTSIELTTTSFLSRAENLFSRHPLLTVQLRDKQPREVCQGWWWADTCLSSTSTGYSSYLPPALYAEILRQADQSCFGIPIPAAELTFGSPQSAMAALSAACVNFGRTLVGLKRLPGQLSRFLQLG